jgi:urease accessory protein
MKVICTKTVVISVMLLGLAMPVWSHEGIGVSHGFMAGFIHPLQGIDHLLVMLAIGLWANRLTGKMHYQLPIVFLALMAFGVGLSLAGIELYLAENVVTFSVIVVGLVIGLNWHKLGSWGLGLVGLFAVSHGYMHAKEMAIDAVKMEYLLGLLLTTALLQGVGFAAGRLSPMKTKLQRIGFSLVSCFLGIYLLTN